MPLGAALMAGGLSLSAGAQDAEQPPVQTLQEVTITGEKDQRGA
jgi:hypothetical protein